MIKSRKPPAWGILPGYAMHETLNNLTNLDPGLYRGGGEPISLHGRGAG